MPRRISADERARWLEDYERGVTETQIATKARSDKRTVKHNLQLAMMERAAAAARVEVIKSTVLHHQGELLESLRKIRESLGAVPKEWTPVTWHCERGEDLRPRIQAATSLAEKRSNPATEPGASAAPSLGGLLMEHLKRDPLPRLLAEYSRHGDLYERALLSLQLKITDVMEAKTGLKMTMGTTASPKSFLYCYTTGDMAFKYALKRAFSTPGEALPLPEIIIYRKEGEVRWGKSQVLAVAKGREETVRKALEAALKALAGSDEVRQVKEARDALEQAAVKARLQAEELLLLGFVAGECRVCRRLGLWTPGGLRK